MEGGRWNMEDEIWKIEESYVKTESICIILKQNNKDEQQLQFFRRDERCDGYRRIIR